MGDTTGDAVQIPEADLTDEQIAVLARHAGLNLTSHDVYVNVAGGLRIDEPAADLAIAVALASSLRDRPVRSLLPQRWTRPVERQGGTR